MIRPATALRAWVVCVVVTWTGAATIRAQDAQEPAATTGTSSVAAESGVGVVRPGRVEVSVLGGLFGGGDLGDGKANLLTNVVPTSGTAALFTTRTRIDAAPLVEGRVGVRLGRRLWIEGGASYSRPDFAVDIASDVEGAPNVTATSTLTQVTADGALHYRWSGSGKRIVPFVMGGAGYLRQLDDTRGTAETGWIVQGGGGAFVRVSPNGRGFWRRLAIRGDVRAVWLRDGIVLSEQRGVTYSASAGLTLELGGSARPAP